VNGGHVIVDAVLLPRNCPQHCLRYGGGVDCRGCKVVGEGGERKAFVVLLHGAQVAVGLLDRTKSHPLFSGSDAYVLVAVWIPNWL